MRQSQSTGIPPRETGHRWQYGLRDIFLVTLGVSVLLGTGQALGGTLGPVRLGLVVLAGVSAVSAGVFTGSLWLWVFGLVLCSLSLWFVSLPLGQPMVYRILSVGLAGGVYAAAGLPVILVSRSGETRWPWMLGAVACFLAAALVTPPDAFSMLIVASPLCLCYILVALAWRRRRLALLVLGPVFLLGGVGIAFGSYLAAYRATADPPDVLTFDQSAPGLVCLLVSVSTLVAQLGAVATFLGLLKGPRPGAESNENHADAS